VTKQITIGERLRAVRRGVRTRAVASGLAAAIALALVATIPAFGDDSGQVDHGVFVFDCYDTGFSPEEMTTDKGPSTIFIHNASGSANQSYTITRKRTGKKKKVLFQGSTVPGQSIAGDTKFASGDVFIIRETTTGYTARITVR